MGSFSEGLANLDSGQALAGSMYFRIASLTKSFTATAILQLVDEHKVGLDNASGQWLPGKISNGDQVYCRCAVALTTTTTSRPSRTSSKRTPCTILAWTICCRTPTWLPVPLARLLH
jgi:CubicO group peptidase (beta-lactamase class C family)